MRGLEFERNQNRNLLNDCQGVNEMNLLLGVSDLTYVHLKSSS